ncbi:MAG: hypothetical protein H6609_11445 [Ignavibacteriales bacterium]|nr:hypothetical protein [Ignavibacteriales bacterium]
MNKNTELFIRYIDHDLSESELNLIEKQLDENSELKLEYENFHQKYLLSKKEIAIDERYFSTIIPNAKNRIVNRKFNYYKKIGIILPILLIGFIYFFNSSSNKFDFKEDFPELLQTFINDDELATDLISNAAHIENTSNISDEMLNEYYEEELNFDPTVFEYLEENVTSNDISNNVLNQLSENEFNTLYQELKNKKIL